MTPSISDRRQIRTRQGLQHLTVNIGIAKSARDVADTEEPASSFIDCLRGLRQF